MVVWVTHMHADTQEYTISILMRTYTQTHAHMCMPVLAHKGYNHILLDNYVFTPFCCWCLGLEFLGS